MTSERKVILYIAMSLDGYIATENGDIGFLSMVEQEGIDYGYAEFIRTIDTVIMGRKTYDKVLSLGIEFPHSDKETYVITRTAKTDIGSIRFYSGSLINLVAKLKAGKGKNIYCDGGAEIVTLLLSENLIDEFYISIIPVLLGKGILLFKTGRPELKLILKSTRQFEKGLVQLHYVRM